ncbi:helix-turn-helix domain-containing protein [Sneathiella glossodoripedis]|uniref:helix-turn-helix domain-containing protein n=1 Tax=Sneathiella glossodoripedis TaxID=418853 RepID=UPI00046FCC46|nr:helix-turn-helix transcriptional regulator [Sneathiella glossodoripedis]
MKHYWIEQRLDQLGYSKTDLAQALSLPPSRVSEILKNKRQLKLSELYPLARFLKYPPSTLLSLLTPSEVKLRNGDLHANPCQEIWVIGQIWPSQQPPNPDAGDASVLIWAKRARYPLNLPLETGEHIGETLIYWALEHRQGIASSDQSGQLTALFVYAQSQSLPLCGATGGFFQFNLQIQSGNHRKPRTGLIYTMTPCPLLQENYSFIFSPFAGL